MNATVDRSSIPAGFFSTQKHHPLKVFPLLKFASARLDLSCSKHPWFFSRNISRDVPKKIGGGGRFLGWDLEFVSKEENFMIEIPPIFCFKSFEFNVFWKGVKHLADWITSSVSHDSQNSFHFFCRLAFWGPKNVFFVGTDLEPKHRLKNCFLHQPSRS